MSIHSLGGKGRAKLNKERLSEIGRAGAAASWKRRKKYTCSSCGSTGRDISRWKHHDRMKFLCRQCGHRWTRRATCSTPH